jgi:signal transduction histidine kinase
MVPGHFSVVPRHKLRAGVIVFLVLTLFGRNSFAAEPVEVESRVLTNIFEIWQLPQPDKSKLYPIKTEVVLYYIDPQWGSAWGECQGQPSYLPIADCPTPLKAGQRVAIDGVVSPQREKFVWEKTKVRVVEENAGLKPETVRNLADQPSRLEKHLITVEGLIDRQMEDPTHFTLNFLGNDSTPAILYVLKDKTNGAPIGFKAGDFVRVKCVYSPQFNRDGKLAELFLWGGASDVEVTGSLYNDARFTVPLVTAETILDNSSTNNMVRVQGVVRGHEGGKWVTLWDATGQILVQSPQTFPLRFGDRVEAVGYPFALGVQHCLHGALYRLSSGTTPGAGTPDWTQNLPLRLAEQVRDLSREDARKELPVSLRGIVTWSHHGTAFAYVGDDSGGVRVVNPNWDTAGARTPGMIVLVTGKTAEGEFVPVITNAVIERAGYWSLGEAQRVSLEEALTGVQDGRWVEMLGLVRNVRTNHGLACFEMSTSKGEFLARTPATQGFDYLKGSIINVRGVCSAVSNARHQLTGIEILAPEAKYLQVEEPAPDDLFAVPLRPLGALRQFNQHNAVNQRVRTAGTVVLHAPGRYLYIQDGSESVLALSEQSGRLTPGDRVEVVGFPGNQGQKFLLREAVFRVISKGSEPQAVELKEMHSVDPDFEGLLARAEGTLINSVDKDGEARLLLQNGNSAFEVNLESIRRSTHPEFKLGSRLSVAGVYEVQNDEYGHARSFHFHLRSWNDVRVLSEPPWWTLARLFLALLIFAIVAVVAIVWSIVIVRKNQLLNLVQADLRTANDQLELRVQERTSQLQEQVAAKERARTELAEAQGHLMLASRQAGMAEVATSVLHNVGNVLNSVNVSATLIAQRQRSMRLGNVAKSAALLQQAPGELARFLTEDPKGKVLPSYLHELSDSLLADQKRTLEEIDYLIKNVEHIKVIVSMQQSHAKAGGVIEALSATELLEDSLQIVGQSFERKGIRLLRSYDNVPPVMVDRHKVLQILINLITNAKHALSNGTPEKTLRLSVSAHSAERVRIVVADNGVGIMKENLSRIFSQGFTTRKDGHGFGLHSGANAARELGGSLSVHSEGPGLGASFTLELPTCPQAPAAPSGPALDLDI